MSDAGLARLIVSLEAKMDQYDKSLDRAEKKAQGTAGVIKKHLDGADDRFSKLFGHSDPGKALDRVFDRSRLAVFEEGATRIPIFGTAVEELGPAGLVAAAGLGALFVVMERSEAAVKFGANIAKVAGQIGVTTDFIQEFNYAAAQSDVDVGAADEALKGLNANLGLVQAGLAKKQLANAFKALGFTPEQLRGYQDAGQLLPVLIQRINDIGSASERAAIAKRLGIEELIPLLNEGADKFAELTQRAQDLGIVMDRETVHAMKEAEDKLKEIDDVMKGRANITFAEFATTIISVKEAFLGAETAALKFLAAVTNTDQDRLTRIKSLKGQIDDILARGGQNEPAGLVLLESLTRQLKAVTLAQQIANTMFPAAKTGPGTPAQQLVAPTAGRKGPIDRSPGLPMIYTEYTSQGGLSDVHAAYRDPAEIDIKPGLDQEAWAKSRQEMESGVHDAWSAGLYAALNGHFFDFIKQKLMESALEGLATALTKIVMENAGNTFVKFAASMFGIPGFAGGTDFAPGGFADVGEHGKERIFLPRGSQVVPHAELANGVRGGGGTVINHYHLDGAVMADELWARIDAGDARATLTGAQLGHQQTMKTLSSPSTRLGR